MKIFIVLFTIILFVSCGVDTKNKKYKNANSKYVSVNAISSETNKTIISNNSKSAYKIILKSNSVPGDIDTNVTKNLNEPIRALAAFYAAMGGTMCNGENCELTTALGLGKQGSEQHKNLIKKYFPTDKVAETVLKQDCYLRPSGASTFSDFEYLTIIDFGDKVVVEYNLLSYNRGDEELTKGPDKYLFKDNTFKNITRNIWKHVDN